MVCVTFSKELYATNPQILGLFIIGLHSAESIR